MARGKHSDGGRKTAKKRTTKASLADKYELYERAVQAPDTDVALVRRMYKHHCGRPAESLREDFCGTGVFACRWVASHPAHRAIGVDLDPEPLAWGRRQHIDPLKQSERKRVELLEGDVRTFRTEPVDVLVAFNFSYFIFRERDELRRYFEVARTQLRDPGLFVLDVYGGPEAMERREERRQVGKFTYVWDQDTFDPIHHESRCYIHFEFGDGSALHRAYQYDWRLWTIPELRDLLNEVGFSSVTVYWEGTERKTNEPNGVFRPRKRADDDPAWVAYLVAKV